MTEALMRPRLIDALAAAPPVSSIVAPAGWGKSALLDGAARSRLRVVPVALGSTEGHPSLLVDALTQGLKRAYPGTAVGAVRAVGGLRTSEPPSAVLDRTRAALGVPTLTLGFDEVERLPRGPVFDSLLEVARETGAKTRVIFTSRQPLPTDLAALAPSALGVDALAMTHAEVVQLIDAEVGGPVRGLARAVLEETGGWPAMVSARLRASRSPNERFADLVPALLPVVEEAIAKLRSETRYVLQVAAIVDRFERRMVRTIVSGEVAGTPEARRRLMRLEPSVVARALDELVRAKLLIDNGEAGVLRSLPGLQRVMRQRFLMQDRTGWQEAHRRAAEARLSAIAKDSDARVGPEVVDLLAASHERERLLEILSRHGSRIELDLAATGDDGRILEWMAVLDGSVVPYWCDVLAGLALARSGDPVTARERLQRARDKLASDRREPRGAWRWQVRIAEAQAAAARAKEDYSDARSWLLRALDQLEHIRKRGLEGADDLEESKRLELRMTISLARLSRESASWDKTREAVQQAIALSERYGADDETLAELRRMLVAGGLAAGDATALEPEAHRAPTDAISQAARIGLALLRDGSIERAISRFRQLTSESDEPLAHLLLARLCPADVVRDQSLDAAFRGSDPWISLEAQVRRETPSEEASFDGFFAAVLAERRADGPGRQLELARDSYRRIGARWEETRLWLILGAAAARRVDDGDGELEAVVRPVDGIIEASQAMGFIIPWSFAGRGETDPERRIRTLLLAGLRGGSERARQTCRLELERLGIDTRAVVSSPERVGAQRTPSQRSAGSAGAPFVQITRGVTRGLSSSEYQTIVNGKSNNQLVVCVPDQLVLNFGRQVSLGQKRVMMPLLLQLLRHPDQSFSMLELANLVWGTAELTSTVQTKVKVAVSRLRALLGKGRHYIITTRKMEGGDSVVAYQAAPQLPFVIIEAATD